MPKDIHKEPDDIAYHNKQQEIDDQVDQLNDQIKVLTADYD